MSCGVFHTSKDNTPTIQEIINQYVFKLKMKKIKHQLDIKEKINEYVVYFTLNYFSLTASWISMSSLPCKDKNEKKIKTLIRH